MVGGKVYDAGMRKQITFIRNGQASMVTELADSIDVDFTGIEKDLEGGFHSHACSKTIELLNELKYSAGYTRYEQLVIAEAALELADMIKQFMHIRCYGEK